MSGLFPRSARSLLVLLGVVALLAAGCPAPEDPDEVVDPEPGPEIDDEAPTEVDPTPTDPDTLTVGIPSDTGGWDQDFLAFDPIGLALFRNTQPYMVEYDITTIDGQEWLDTQNTFPLYAESWEPNEDFTTWTLTLREGIEFPSGNELTAEDVKWSQDRGFAAQANVAGIYRLIGLTEPEQVEVVDDYTVEFHQDWPSALTDQIQAIALYVFDSELAQEHVTDDDPWATEWINANPQEGGPYNVASYTPGEEIVLEANPEFPGEPPGVERVRLLIIPSESTRRLQLEAGDLDIALGLSRRDVQDLRGSEGIEVVSSPSNEFVFMPMDMTVEPFDDQRVRQALAHAIPYDALLESIYEADARRSRSFVPLDMPGHVDTGYPYDHDPERAQELLAEAGYEDGFSTELVIEAGNEEHERLAIAVQSAFEDVGVDLEIESVDIGTLSERRAEGDVAFQIAEGQLWIDDVEYLIGVMLLEGAFLNYSGYNNPRINEIFEELNTAIDEDERFALAEEAQDILAEEVPWLLLGQPNFNVPMRDHVEGWVQPVDGLFRLRYLEISE